MTMGHENMIGFEYVCFKWWTRLYAFGVVVEDGCVVVLHLMSTYYIHPIQQILNTFDEMPYSVHPTS